MNVSIRPAQENEINILLNFENGIIEAERPFDSTLKEGEIHYYDLVELIRSSEAEVVVAVVDEEVVGSGFAKIKKAEAFLKHDRFAYLGFMYVKPEFRRMGINQLILGTLINWAKSKGLSEIRLQVYDENVNAKKAYFKAGFKPDMLVMRMEI